MIGTACVIESVIFLRDSMYDWYSMCDLGVIILRDSMCDSFSMCDLGVIFRDSMCDYGSMVFV